MNKFFRSNQWHICSDKLPSKLNGHQLAVFKNKLILTGGIIHGEGTTNNVWEGNLSFEPELRIIWTSLPSMHETRKYHVSVVINENLFCIGGVNTNTTEYFCFTTNSWKMGPKLPFKLYGAKVIFNPTSHQCIIIGGKRDNEPTSKVSLFDTLKGLIDIEGTLGAALFHHIAVLL